MIVVNVLPAFAAIIRAVNAGFLFRLGGQIQALRIAGCNGDADAAEQIVSAGKAFGDLPPRGAAVRGFVKPAAGNHKRFSAANFPRGNSRRPESREENLRVAGVHHHVGAAGVLVFIENFLESFPAVERTEYASLYVRSIRMPLHGNENAVGVPWVDDDSGNLLGIVQSKMLPRLTRID